MQPTEIPSAQKPTLTFTLPEFSLHLTPLQSIPKEVPDDTVHLLHPYILDILESLMSLEAFKEGNTTNVFRNSMKKGELGTNESLFQFFESFLKTEQGARLLQHLHIQDIHRLTPEKAMKLSVELVLRFIKYNDDLKKSNSRIDQGTVLSMLKEGEEQRRNPQWKGNGVCRNFSSGLQATFFCLKNNQITPNALHNLHCFEIVGLDHKTKKDELRDEIGHTWNLFLLIKKHQETCHVHATLLDITTEFKRRSDFPQKSRSCIDVTTSRFTNLLRLILDRHPLSPEELSQVVTHLVHISEKGNPMWSTHEEKEHFFLSEALRCIHKHHQHADISPALAQNLFQNFAPHAHNADEDEKKALHILAETHQMHDMYKKLFAGENGKKA